MKMRTTWSWIAFLAAHVLVAWLGWMLPSQPMGDVVLVYQPWSAAALGGETIVGITESWVYPQPALLPMLVTQFLAWPLTGLVGSTGAYLIGWAVLVTALDAVGFGVLVGRTGTAARRSAGWLWTAALVLLGPIAMYRIDAITVPLAVIGGCWLVQRPVMAAALLTLSAWIKIWPGALVAAAIVALRTRARVLVTVLAVSAAIIAALLLLGADQHLFGFLAEQTGRGLQVEAVAATPFMWLAVTGAAMVEYSFGILTFQIVAPGAEIVAALLTPLMALAVIGLLVLALVRLRSGVVFPRLFPPLAMALVVVLIVTNKVGSPQFETWLIAPMILWVVFDRSRSGLPAGLVLVLCGVTFLLYPLTYDALLRAEPMPVLLLTIRNALLIVLLIVAVRAILRTPRATAVTRR